MKAIFTFHSIDDTGSILAYPPKMFAFLLKSLDQMDLPVLDLGSLLDPATPRGVALTFDDGMFSVHENALPVLKEFSAPAHVFVSSAVIGSTGLWPKPEPGIPGHPMMNWEHVEDLHRHGVLIDSHTHTHEDMRLLTPEQMEEQCDQVDEIISRRLGRRPEYFAYPFGYHNASARDFVRTRYRASVTTEFQKLSPANDPAALPRLDSFYFQHTWLITHLDSFIVNSYIHARSLLRTWRGSQRSH